METFKGYNNLTEFLTTISKVKWESTNLTDELSSKFYTLNPKIKFNSVKMDGPEFCPVSIEVHMFDKIDKVKFIPYVIEGITDVEQFRVWFMLTMNRTSSTENTIKRMQIERAKNNLKNF